MSKRPGFDPYFDYDSVNEEMASDFHEALSGYEEAKKEFLRTSSIESFQKILLLQHKLNGIFQAVHETIFTQPMMVHVAGRKVVEESDSGEEVTIQRCVRCGSVLQIWGESMAIMGSHGPRQIEEEEIPWWSEGDLVAKTDDPHSITMYEVEKSRDLEKHELMCPDLAGELSL